MRNAPGLGRVAEARGQISAGLAALTKSQYRDATPDDNSKVLRAARDGCS